MKGPLSQIGRYRVEEVLGKGGMATVYRAMLEGAEGFERPVALKVLHPHLADDPEFVRMFNEEARLASRLAHPALVPVRDLGVLDGTHFMVMDLLEGETLGAVHERFRDKDLPFPRGHACFVMAAVLDGLHYAHELLDEAGRPLAVVHRDVSPKNIFIGFGGAVRLVDFGIARTEPTKGLTRLGVVKGTLPYMAPEQARGAPVDRRADLFAAGVVLYELLTSKVPLDVDATDAQRRALAEGRLAPDFKRIHTAVRPVLERALAPLPDGRYATAAEFADALRKALPLVEPNHEPEKLAALVASRGVRRKPLAEKPKRAPKKRKGRGEDEAAPASGAASKRPKAPPPPPVQWEGATLMLVTAVVLLVAGLVYTFTSAASG